MKLIDVKGIYVQQKDLIFLLKLNDTKQVNIPEEIINSIYDKILISSYIDDNKFIRFTNPDEIAFFQKLDFILNPQNFNQKSDLELMNLLNSKILEKQNMIHSYFSLPFDVRSEKFKSDFNYGQFLEFQISEIRDIIDYKQGKSKVKMPKLVCGFIEATGDEPSKSSQKVLKLFKQNK